LKLKRSVKTVGKKLLKTYERGEGPLIMTVGGHTTMRICLSMGMGVVKRVRQKIKWTSTDITLLFPSKQNCGSKKDHGKGRT